MVSHDYSYFFRYSQVTWFDQVAAKAKALQNRNFLNFSMTLKLSIPNHFYRKSPFTIFCCMVSLKVSWHGTIHTVNTIFEYVQKQLDSIAFVLHLLYRIRDKFIISLIRNLEVDGFQSNLFV